MKLEIELDVSEGITLETKGVTGVSDKSPVVDLTRKLYV